MPEPNQLHIDAILNLSIQYKNEELIWRYLMPQLKVEAIG